MHLLIKTLRGAMLRYPRQKKKKTCDQITYGIAGWPAFFSCCLLKQQSWRHSTTGSAWSPLGNADLISQRNVLASVQRVNNKQRTGKTCTPCLQTDLRGRCALCLLCRISPLTLYQRLEKVYHCLIWCIHMRGPSTEKKNGQIHSFMLM